jgi:small multidrug resistance family-3 protein
MMVRSLLFFVLAGLCEIGGGYLVWLALREGKSRGWRCGRGDSGHLRSGANPATHPFGRAYAAYGGIFIVLSIAWGWIVDQVSPIASICSAAGSCCWGFW